MRAMGGQLLGVISDTHGLLRPEAVHALQGCDLILHAGDIGTPEVLTGLAEIAPLVAVRGNVDGGRWAAKLPMTELVEVGEHSLYLLHDVSQLDLDPAAAGIVVVISGHAHQPRVERKDGILFLNPGSAGPRRFRLPVALARLRLGGGPPEAEIVELEPA